MTSDLFSRPAAAIIAALALTSCGGGASSSTPTSPTNAAASQTTTQTLPSAYARIGGSATVTLEGTTIVIRTSDVPDHASPYWGVGSSNYEAPHSGMQVNPHRIAAQNIVLRVPASPSAAAPSDTPLGPIGIAVNGVVFFNQYAAGRMPLSGEIFSFDRYNGHPSPSNQYHYHVEPLWLTAARGKAAFLGVLLDGFPVYGTLDESGGAPVDLDSCNGHTGVTTDFPQGTYHYHVTSAPPYISGCFHGSPGTVTG